MDMGVGSRYGDWAHIDIDELLPGEMSDNRIYWNRDLRSMKSENNKVNIL